MLSSVDCYCYRLRFIDELAAQGCHTLNPELTFHSHSYLERAVDRDMAFIGEIGLGGELRSVNTFILFLLSVLKCVSLVYSPLL